MYDLQLFDEFLGAGGARRVYGSYTIKDVVIKIATDIEDEWQNDSEKRLFDIMTDEEKKCIPIIGYDKMCIYWRRAIPVSLLMLSRAIPLNLFDWAIGRDIFYNLQILIDAFYLVLPNILSQTIRKYGIDDINPENLGVVDNRLCIIDAGLWYEDCFEKN